MEEITLPAVTTFEQDEKKNKHVITVPTQRFVDHLVAKLINLSESSSRPHTIGTRGASATTTQEKTTKTKTISIEIDRNRLSYLTKEFKDEVLALVKHNEENPLYPE